MVCGKSVSLVGVLSYRGLLAAAALTVAAYSYGPWPGSAGKLPAPRQEQAAGAICTTCNPGTGDIDPSPLPVEPEN